MSRFKIINIKPLPIQRPEDSIGEKIKQQPSAKATNKKTTKKSKTNLLHIVRFPLTFVYRRNMIISSMKSSYFL